MRSLRLAALLAVLAQDPPAPEEAPPPAALRKRITLKLDAPVGEWVEALRRETGADIALDPKAGGEFVDLDRKIRFHLHDMSAVAALHWVAEASGCRVVVARDTVRLVPIPHADARARVARLHPTRPAHHHLPDEPGGRLEVPADPQDTNLALSGGPHEAPPERESFDEILFDLIKGHVFPGTWEGGQTLERSPGGKILAVATPRVQREIEAFLERLGSFSTSTIRVAATISDAADDLRPGPVAAADLDALLRRLRSLGAREIDLSAFDGHRAHSAARREAVGPVAIARGDAVLKARIADAAVLDVRPCLAEGGRATRITLRLSLGQARELASAEAKAGRLPLQERAVTRISTTLLIPDGGGVLLSLPARDAKPQVCLVRAAVARTAAAPAQTPAPIPDEAVLRLAKAPAADLHLDKASLEEFSAWLRKTSGLSVLFPRDLPAATVTVHAKAVAPKDALPLVLQPLGLAHVARNEAVLILPRDVFPALRDRLFDVRDLVHAPPDFSRHEDGESEWTPEDFANLVKNNIHRDRWEEADGKSIMPHRGLLLLRNSGDVLDDVGSFLDLQRATARPRVALRAEILDAPADSVDAELKNQAAKSMLLEPEQRERLLAAGRAVERLDWPAYNHQRTLLEWERARDVLHETDPANASLRSVKAASFLEIRPTLQKDGKTFDVALEFQDQHFLEGFATQEISTRTSVEIPGGQTALFRWTAAGRSRLLLLTPTLIP